MRLRSAHWLVAPIAMFACSSNPTMAPGGSLRTDASVSTDGGARADAAASDASTPADSGAAIDAGAANDDAGTPVDAGSPVDAGGAADAAVADAGGPADTGVSTDAGTAPDAAMACTYPAGATEPMTVGRVITPYRWSVAIDPMDVRLELDLARFYCANDPNIDWRNTEHLMFASVPEW